MPQEQRLSSGRSNLAEQPDRRTRLSVHCAAHSARVPMTGAVFVQCCAVLAGDGLAPAGRANGVLASVLAALLCCTVVCVTYVCIHEIERSLNFNLYNTDYLFVPRASRASTRGCSPARFLHCAIAPQGASETKHDLSSTKISYTQMSTQNLWVIH